MDSISNYRQVRLIISPWEGEWARAYWSVHFLTVKQGIPRSQVADDGSYSSAPTSRSRRTSGPRWLPCALDSHTC